tara:strand:- start:461 stop:727 length:267 start_codon:yes stop_codon:yes gene_type:complete
VVVAVELQMVWVIMEVLVVEVVLHIQTKILDQAILLQYLPLKEMMVVEDHQILTQVVVVVVVLQQQVRKAEIDQPQVVQEEQVLQQVL